MILEEVPFDYCAPYKSYRIPKRNLCPQLLPAIVQVRPGTTVTGAVCKRSVSGRVYRGIQILNCTRGGGRELPYSDSTFGRIRCPIFTE
jgi:hypothetical protein